MRSRHACNARIGGDVEELGADAGAPVRMIGIIICGRYGRPWGLLGACLSNVPSPLLLLRCCCSTQRAQKDATSAAQHNAQGLRSLWSTGAAIAMDEGMADTACYDTGQDATTVQYCTGGPQVITRQYRPARCGGEAGTRVNRKRGPCVCVVCVCPAAPPVFRCDLRAAREVVSPRARARRPGRPFAAWCRWPALEAASAVAGGPTGMAEEPRAGLFVPRT